MRVTIPLVLLALVAPTSAWAWLGGASGAVEPGGAPGELAAADGGADAAKGSKPDVPACISVSAFVVNSAPGFDHVVRLASSCQKDARCTVSTDVSPEPIHVELPAGETREVVTFRGAPGYAFEASVKCELQE